MNVENVRGDLKLELIDLQCSFILKTKFENIEVSEMFKVIPNYRNVLFMFYSSYIC